MQVETDFSKKLELFASAVTKIKAWRANGSKSMLIIATPRLHVDRLYGELLRDRFLIFSFWRHIRPPEHVFGNAYLRLFEPNFEKLSETFHNKLEKELLKCGSGPLEHFFIALVDSQNAVTLGLLCG